MILTRADDGQVRDRRRLSFAGSVVVSLVLSEKGVLLAEPEVAVVGLPTADNEGTPFTEIARDAVIGTLESLPKPKRKDQALVSEAVRRSVRAAVNQAWGKKPMCSVLLTVL
jgi:ribonuclease J